MDGSTDKSNADNEATLVIWFDPEGENEKVCTRIGYLTVYQPHHVTAEELFETVHNSLRHLRVETLDDENANDEAVDPGVLHKRNSINSNKKLVGMGTDGAANKIAAQGLKGLVEQKILDVVLGTPPGTSY